MKIASPELTHHDLLRACAAAGLDIILSTGMSTEQQVSEAVAVIERGGVKVTLLHCVSSYPAPPEEMNLRAMRRLSRYGPVGLSDHTQYPVIAPTIATALWLRQPVEPESVYLTRGVRSLADYLTDEAQP